MTARTVPEDERERREDIRSGWERMTGLPWPTRDDGSPLPVLLASEIDWSQRRSRDELMAAQALLASGLVP